VGSFVLNRADAEDVLQEVALTLVDRFESYDPSRPFIAWSLGVARKVIKAHFRKQLRRPLTSENDTAVDRVASAFETLHPQVEDMKEALSECIQRLSTADKQMLAMQYEDELKPAAIADRIGKSPNHVAVLLHRLRTGLRQCMERRLTALPNAS